MTDRVEQCDREAAKIFLLALGFPSLVRTVDGSLALLDEGGEAALQTLAADRTASEQRGYDRAIAEVVARMKRIEPDEELAGCPASWGDFLQILESVAIEAGEHKL